MGRHHRIEMKVHASTPVSTLHDEGDGPDAVTRSEDRRQLSEALATLPPDDRLILALRWFEELTEREMADALDVRPGTVKSRLSRAMTRLRAAIAEQETTS